MGQANARSDAARTPDMQPWHLIARTLALACAGCALGVASNGLRAEPLTLGWYEPATECEIPASHEPVVSAPESIAALCAGEDVLVVDTRSSTAFAQGHVAGATHLPCSAPRLQAEQMLELVGPHRAVVLYGSGTDDALAVARSLNAAAARLDTYVIQGGFDAWQNAALACASGPCEQCSDETVHAH